MMLLLSNLPRRCCKLECVSALWHGCAGALRRSLSRNLFSTPFVFFLRHLVILSRRTDACFSPFSGFSATTVPNVPTFLCGCLGFTEWENCSARAAAKTGVKCMLPWFTVGLATMVRYHSFSFSRCYADRKSIQSPQIKLGVFLWVAAPKLGRHGRGKVQHARIADSFTIRLALAVFSDIAADEPVWDFSFLV